MDNKKKQEIHKFDIWPPPREVKKVEKVDKSPKNISYKDISEDLSDVDNIVYEAEEELEHDKDKPQI